MPYGFVIAITNFVAVRKAVNEIFIKKSSEKT